jgi:hypothetical protein
MRLAVIALGSRVARQALSPARPAQNEFIDTINAS